MKKTLYLLVSLVILTSMVLSACKPEAPVVEEPVAVEEPAVVEEPVVEEPVVEEPVVEVDPADADLDGGYGKLISTMEGYNALKDIAAIAEMLAEDTPPFLLDVRSVSELEENGHIEGAVNIPLRDLAKHLDLLPDFDTQIIAYCGSGWRAAIAMPALTALGWNDVKTFHPPSYGGWVAEGYPIIEGAAPEAMVLDAANPDPAMVAAMDEMLSAIPEGWGVVTGEALNTELVENPDLILIDVRKPAEFEASIIDAPNVTWVTLDDFINLKDQWPADLDTPIVTYCKAGHRSTVAMTILMSYGYTNVRSLKGGFVGWQDAGYAILADPTLADTYGAMLETMEGYNTIKADALLVEMAEDTPPFLLDVRSAAELEESGHIEGAFNIPLNELAQHTDLLPGFDTPIVVYCGTGWRATIGMTALHAMGWTDVRTLKYTFADWVADGNPVGEGVPEAVVLDAAQPVDSLVAAVDPALISVKDMGTKWGVNPAEDVNLALSENPELILIDVRRAEELTEKGVIAVVDQELIAIPLEDFIASMDMWPAEKDAEIVIYCGSGHRSTMAMTILLTEGYSNVTSLKGGFGGWVEAGFPVAEFVTE
ncbi:MAG: rhodanese-like domain-containing protein [Chloroflexota bacterium]